MLPPIFANPDKFKGQWPEETIITSLRYHPIVMTKAAIVGLLPLVAGTASLIWLSQSWRLWPSWILICLGLVVFARQWLLWFWSHFFVTDQRLILIDYQGLFNKKVLEITYDQIANQNHEIRGFFNTIMSIGSIEIHNLAGTNPLVISDLSHPERLGREISQALHDWQSRRGSNPPPPSRPTGTKF